mmetsp:Transcript_2138/g.3913  ORF Transcript_2138/g.3913 Transcript_2138/m.3913 type:complete len:308 (+) Transcript_2138:23-946(+)
MATARALSALIRRRRGRFLRAISYAARPRTNSKAVPFPAPGRRFSSERKEKEGEEEAPAAAAETDATGEESKQEPAREGEGSGVGEEEWYYEGDEVFVRELQNSAFPMFLPTAATPEAYLPFTTILGMLQYVRFIDHEFDWVACKEGITQARRYVMDRFEEGDLDSIRRVASEEVVTAFSETLDLWGSVETHKFTYSLESIEKVTFLDSRLVLENNAENEEPMSMLEYISLYPPFWFVNSVPTLSGRFEIDVSYTGLERFEMRDNDTDKLAHPSMEKSHRVTRSWRFSKAFERSNAERSPWLLEAIL